MASSGTEISRKSHKKWGKPLENTLKRSHRKKI